jgi:hypothetical protein
MKFSWQVVPLMMTSTPYFLIVPSTIPKWWKFILLRWMPNLYQSAWDHEILYSDRSSNGEQLLMRPFL